MPISLQKGQKVSLTKGNPGLTKVVVGLGWDVNAFDLLRGLRVLRQSQAQFRRGGASGR